MPTRALRAILWLLLWAGPALALPAPPPLPAGQKAGKENDIRFLYPAGQVYKHDKVFPLVMELTNRGSEAKTYRPGWPLSISLPKAAQTVKLEPGDTRRFTLNLPRNEAGNATSFTLNGRDYSTELTPCPRSFTTGLLSPPSEKFDYLRTLKLEVDPSAATNTNDPNAKPALVPLAALSILEPELLPEGWPMLSCLDVIIAYDLQSMVLSNLQKQALVSWVCQGGRLVLVSDGTPEEFRGTPFEEHLPLKPTEVTTDQGLVQVTGKLTPQAEVMMSYHGQPLLVRKNLMRGSIFLVTAPLTQLAPLTVEEAETLWREVQPGEQFDPNTGGYNSYGYNYNYYPSLVSNTLKNIPELPRAGPGWVALFLLVYALIVGPVNLGLLRRRDKMLWSFVTVPVIALLFAGSAYLLNRATRSSVPVLRELGVLQVNSGDKRGYGISEGLFFSPGSGLYQVDCEPDAICHPATYSYDEAPFGLYGNLSNGGLAASISMGTWDVFMLNTESLISLPSPIKGRFENNVLTVDSPFSTGPDEAQLFCPELGSSATFSLKGGSQSEKLELKDPTSYSKFDKLGDPKDKMAHPGRRELLQAISNQTGTVFEAKKTYLLFWTDKLTAPIQPQGAGLHRAEYLVVLELEGPDAPQKVDPSGPGK